MGEQLKSEKLKSLSVEQKFRNIHKTVDLTQRMMIVMKENSVPRLHQIIKTAMRNKRSLQYVVSKMIDAVDGIYKPNFEKSDKDLALLIAEIGGPAAISLLHKARGFPSTSYCYKLMKKCSKVLKTSIDLNLDEIFQNITWKDIYLE